MILALIISITLTYENISTILPDQLKRISHFNSKRIPLTHYLNPLQNVFYGMTLAIINFMLM